MRGDDHAWNDLRPAGINRTAADDVAFSTALADAAVVEFATDPLRVYVTGVSNGGMIVDRLLIEAPGRFAAATFVAAVPASAPLEVPAVPKPLLIVNGTRDPLARWEGGPIRLPESRLVRRIIGPECRDAEGAALAWALTSRLRSTGAAGNPHRT
ncbi:prolyl oligopeptidase family serine peptidase [Elioraea sp.]|uniref:prolyl oligopeptidase family serine peptidase n=1 Tax=Elioraea sp. TaxID=2185103 RepID=UPI003F715AF8